MAVEPAAPVAMQPAKTGPGSKESDTRTGPDKKAAPDQPVEQGAPIGPPAPQPSACRLALTEDIAIAPSIPAINGPGACGGDDLVRLEAVVLPDQHRVSLNPAATLRCSMATAIVDWVRTDIAPLAASAGGEISGLENFDSFDCRGRNGIAGAPLSEHGRANALDVHAFQLADGKSITLTDRDVPRSLREDVLHSACTRFTTVLGPGSDGYHEDHIHLDLMQRHNNYKICQWNVWDPLPQIAPLLPEKRPDEAPPRQVAAGQADQTKPDAVTPKPDVRSAPATRRGAEGDAPDMAETKEKAKDGARDQTRPQVREKTQDQAKQTTRPAATTLSPGKAATSKPATKKRRSRRRF
ncbi:MAG: extensin family protein [Bradyrhizobium sp.]